MLTISYNTFNIIKNKILVEYSSMPKENFSNKMQRCDDNKMELQTWSISNYLK